MLLSRGASAGRPTGVLLPITAAGPSPDTSQVDMPVATTRKSSADREVLFSCERSNAVTYTDFSISIPPDAIRQPGSVQWLKSVPGDPATDFVTLRANPVDHPKVSG